jgi:hypothetical protein
MNIKSAKAIPLADALTRLGFSPVRRRGNDLWYASPFRAESEPSFKLNLHRNQWYDFGQGKGGDLIDFVRELYRLGSVAEALKEIARFEGGLPPPQDSSFKPDNDNQAAGREDSSPFTLIDEQPLHARHLLKYLGERCINLDLARQHVREVHYQRADQVYFAIGLANASGGLEVRNRYFKGTIGRKDLSIIPGPTHRVFVFEGMFDYLTALSLRGGELDGTAIVLNSVATQQKAVDEIRKLGATVVELYRDHDDAGQSLLAFMKEQLPDLTVVDWADLYVGHNDLNEWHVQRENFVHGRGESSARTKG